MTDLISRQAAIEAVNTMFAPLPTQMSIVEDCLEILENLPSVEVEPVKRGKWMYNADVRCSRCGHKLQTTGLPSYCPNCEAKMKGAKNEL